jgi:ankyrin repeat protein
MKKIFHITIFFLLLLSFFSISARNRYRKLDYQLLEAVRDNDFSKTEELLSSGANVNVTDNKGYTALMYCSFRPRVGVLLIEHGANVHAKNNDGDSVFDLLKYIEKPDEYHLLLLKLLIEKGGFPEYKKMPENENFKIFEKYTINSLTLHVLLGNLDIIRQVFDEEKVKYNSNQLLYYSVISNNQQLIEYLFKTRSINSSSGHYLDKAVIAAVKLNRVEALQFFLNSGYDINENKNFCSSLTNALDANSIEMMKMIFDAGEKDSSAACLKREVVTNMWFNESRTDYLFQHVRTIEAAEYLESRGVEVKQNEIVNPLYFAAINNNLNLIRYYISKGLSVDSFNKSHSPLCRAVSQNNMEMVKLLLENGASPNETDKYPPLFYALSNNNTEMVKFLIEEGADPNIVGTDNLPPLATAAANSLSATKYLISKGADPKDPECLYYAALSDYNETFIYLVENGANPDNPKAINEIIENGNVELLKYILRKGVSLNRQDYLTTTLKYDENLSMVYYIINNRELFKVSQKEIDEALSIAVYKNNYRMVKYLLENGANSNYKNKYGNAPLHLVKDKNEDTFPVMQELLKHGADVNAKNRNDQTALHRINKPESALLLIKNGVDINAVTNSGNTALHLACEENLTDLASVLIEHGIDADKQDNEGNTALHIAARKKNSDIVTLLLSKGVSINILNKDNKTPLFLSYPDYKISEILLKHGADPEFKSNDQTFFEQNIHCMDYNKLYNYTKVFIPFNKKSCTRFLKTMIQQCCIHCLHGLMDQQNQWKK